MLIVLVNMYNNANQAHGLLVSSAGVCGYHSCVYSERCLKRCYSLTCAADAADPGGPDGPGQVGADATPVVKHVYSEMFWINERRGYGKGQRNS